MAANDQKPPAQPLRSTETADFDDKYANNTHVESSFWDVRARFGVLDQSSSPASVKWHTAVNMPWAQAKLFAFYLQLHITAHEASNGKIPIPNSLKPPPIEAIAAALPNDAGAQVVVERAKRLREEFD